MNRILLFLSALLLAPSAYAQAWEQAPKEENQVLILDAIVSDIVENDGANYRVFVKLADGQIYNTVFTGCNITWKSNEPFYMIVIKDTGVFLTTRSAMNGAMQASGNDFLAASKLVIGSKMMCIVTQINKAG